MKSNVLNKLNMLRKITSHEMFPPAMSLLMLYIISASISPQFLTTYNQYVLILQTVPLALLALGESLIIMMGSIDLSPGSVMALTGTISAILIKQLGFDPGLGIAAGILCGTLIGFLNGLMVTKAKIFSFVSSLAILVIGRGFVLILTQGRSITGLVEFRVFTYVTILGLPVMVWVFILLLIVLYIVVRRTSVGLVLYGLGGNEEAVRVSGVRVDFFKVLAFSLAGTLYGLSGQIMNARLEIAYPWTGWGYELDAIASCVLGGYYLTGGVGNPVGPVLGAYVLTMITNIFVLIGLDPYFQWVVKGIILIGAAAILTRGLRYVK
ncbi:ABC transporter permease [Ignisphaera sp. 4213-co]|uniref:ABC transporter permease n=1 Tax=Ignisphaera cupida TaxID=3050454 RepID=A0ABD4Z776_9CREN|nr:ABC transporter permease [Ignisphaera sp. 4213-co]MDK6029186.1 ABC transporter permease [Ignisphaera sp. 4213-co]